MKINFKFRILVLIGLVIFFLVACNAQPEPTLEPTLEPTPEPTPEPTSEWEREGWTLIWQDEFEGEELEPAKWEMEIGGHGWGNNEHQFYTNRPENVRLEEGQLIIEAHEEFFVRRHYTSGRIKTQNKFSFTYGRVEARMKLPFGQGIWPAFWMLGVDIDQVGWPASGEIDIMEHIGRQPRYIYGTVHGPGYSGSGGVGHFTTFPDRSLYEAFHVYAIEWEPEEIRWFVDEENFFTLTPEQVPGEWVFDHPFFLLLNLAVGGDWPGYPDESTQFPQQYVVDYVRVYQTPERAAEFLLVEGGSMHVSDISVSSVEAEDGWQGSVVVTVVNESGSPVEGATVSGGWVGAITRGEETGLTDSAGQVTLNSETTEKSGEVTFCVTQVYHNGYNYDKSANPQNCDKTTP